MKTSDGTELFVKDWGRGNPVMFVHSWALTNEIWQYQHASFVERGHRIIAFDRRGHGRSAQPGTGYDIDRLADDLAEVIRDRDLRDLTLIGHSMGCAEIVRYIARHGTSRLARIVLVAPVTPYLVRTDDNPIGIPLAAYEARWTSWRADFAGWARSGARAFFMLETSDAILDWGVGMMTSLPVWIAIETFRTMVTTDFRADLARIDVPALVVHGTADASANIAITGKPTAERIAGARFQIYEGAPHGLMVTHGARLEADIETFITSKGPLS